MRIACIHMPRFAIQVEQCDEPALAEKPLILGNYHHASGQVYDVSVEAEEYGVVPGIPLRQAYSLCPEGVFRPYCEERSARALGEIVSLLGQLCPLVEPAPPDHVLLGLRYETDEVRFARGALTAVQDAGFRVSCGIASSRFVAAVASAEAEEGSVLSVRDGEELLFLHDLPLEYLPVSDNSIRRLQLFGISTIGEMLALPRGAVEAQFGAEGRTLLDLARGGSATHVDQWRDESDFTRTRSFGVPVESKEELHEALCDAVDSVCLELQERWRCCRVVALTLCLEGGAVAREVMRFKEPVSSEEVMRGRFSACIEALGLSAPVEELRLEVSGLCAESGKQSSFLDISRRPAGQFQEAVRFLQQRYGREVIKRVVSRKTGRTPEDKFMFAACDGDG